MNEQQWERKLKIQTSGIDASHADSHHHPYEPTPYSVLERLAASGYVRPDTTWIDYGCGKGRVGFFLNNQTGCRAIGVECDEHVYRDALENRASYGSPDVDFVCAYAENYLPDSGDCFYFFNPFSVEILRAVLSQIVTSCYRNPRVVRLFFYYPHDAYLAELMTSELTFLDEIDCRDLFPGKDSRERVMIFQWNSLQNAETVL